VLLVGFMGSGKTRVGRLLSERLDWSFRDFDQEIGLRQGLSIPEIFRQHGEEYFRNLEETVGRELLLGRRVVLASGGGWPAAQGRMDALGPETLSVWLRVAPEEAVRRIRKDGPLRPLLAVSDPVGRAKLLLREREPFYAKAEVTLDSEGAGVEHLAEQIEHLMHERGWESLPSFAINTES
jgi:shikimate kinase